jgi:hypothetical protein
MKLKETASTEYRRIRNHWEVIQEFIMESNSSNSFSFSYKGRQGGCPGSFEIQQLGENHYYTGEE